MAAKGSGWRWWWAQIQPRYRLAVAVCAFLPRPPSYSPSPPQSMGKVGNTGVIGAEADIITLLGRPANTSFPSSTITTPTTRHLAVRLHDPPRISTSLHRAATPTNISQRLLTTRLPNPTHYQLAILASSSPIASTTSTATISKHVPSRSRSHRNGQSQPSSELCFNSICLVSSFHIFQSIVFCILARGFCTASREETTGE